MNVVQYVPHDKHHTDIVPKNQDLGIAKRKRRPARRQTDIRNSDDKTPAATGAVYNIWYGKWSGGEQKDKYAPADQAVTKCDPARDSGWTRADKKTGTYFCLFFARGCCPNGPDCNFLHRVPQPTDIFSPNVDCFGRDKHADYKDDMTGVGSFLRQNSTLYVGKINPTDDIEEVVSQQFCQWGEVERIRVLNSRGVAFITYAHQNSAEFAKEAMMNQPLNSNETISIRWATQDPNPSAAARDQKRAEEAAAEAIRRILPKEFLEELEGTGEKRKRLDYGLEGYEPPDELWYQRGQHAINPAGRTNAPELSSIEAADDSANGKSDELINSRVVTALKSLAPTKDKSLALKRQKQETTTLVAYDSDEE